MITEDYVSFEIAKLLKEKGFTEYTFSDYSEDGIVGFNEVETRVAKGYQRPTLQMAMKWLREVHKLYVNVCPSVEGDYWAEKWHSYVENLEKRYPFGKFIGTFNSHEQACEEAIKYCLENLA